MSDSTQDLLQFPCQFPIKIMGHNVPELFPEICEVAAIHIETFDASMVESRESKGGNYVALTITFEAQSRIQLDNFYLALTSHPLVKVVL